MAAQRIADIDLLACHGELHGFQSPLLAGVGLPLRLPVSEVGTRPATVKRFAIGNPRFGVDTVSWSFPMPVVSQREQLIPAALHRRRDAHRIAGFCDGAAGAICTRRLHDLYESR